MEVAVVQSLEQALEDIMNAFSEDFCQDPIPQGGPFLQGQLVLWHGSDDALTGPGRALVRRDRCQSEYVVSTNNSRTSAEWANAYRIDSDTCSEESFCGLAIRERMEDMPSQEE